ncbi:two-component system, cell cycle response regulator [Aliiroseovarius halocynthiae]|uniref:diguanylate cyclase n=1 Tax=Aliiroseovarius halocynthiae TaxID=985055 RepID=A0A545SVB7_9RHOB|nr:diguanylate cyclase [Aliiroseovarius halocynthiae]TQV68903.1 diguanylate cyclase [Aliiroseovarius halocynthiae]SMR71452.1 two-component system, cell cycle response regulator [Aliiroseovarius halocynthiae]
MSGRILIADDLATNRIVLKVKLTVSGYDVIQVEQVDDVLDTARRAQPDLIILGRGQAVQNLSVCTSLKSDPILRSIPVILFAEKDGPAARNAALQAGADDVYSRGVKESTLSAMVRNLIRARATCEEVTRHRDTSAKFGCAESAASFVPAAHIALVAPDPETGLLWRRTLGTELPHRLNVMTKVQALGDMNAVNTVPDAFIISASLDEDSDGLRLVSELRARVRTRHAIIIVVPDEERPSDGAMALDLGADAILHVGFQAAELALRLKALLARKRELDTLRKRFDQDLSLAVQDPLTGLHNRRYAQSYLNRLEQEALTNGQPYAILVLDLDHFKSINDRFGHGVGDQVLVEVANRLRNNLREFDLLARFGGEEFMVALPDVSSQDVATMAERLRRAIGDHPIDVADATFPIRVTVSVGVAVWGDMKNDARSAHELTQAADQALYASKSDGRNVVTFGRSAA